MQAESALIWTPPRLSYWCCLHSSFFILRSLVFHPFLEDADLRESKTVKMRETAEELEARANELKEKHRSAIEAATQEAQEARRELRVEDYMIRKIGLVRLKLKHSLITKLNQKT